MLAAITLPAYAQTDQTAPPDPLERTPTRNLEVSTGAQYLTGALGSWRHLTLRGVLEKGDHVFLGELSHKREFNTSGNFLGLTDTYSINSDWFTSVSLGVGDGAFYLPRHRFDGFLYRKWLPKKNFVSSVGVGYYGAPDGHIDRSIALGGAYYFEQPWVMEVGIRFNRSNPGRVNTHQQYAAVSFNPDKSNTFTTKYAWGGEGYVPLAATTSIVGFNSSEISLGWRHRIDPNWGFSISANHYRNPTYKRSGIDIGVNHQFD